MTEPAAPTPAQPICQWCSAELPSATETTCPSCGATLVGEVDGSVPGVTAIDAEAIVRGARAAMPERRSRLLTWITGEEPNDEETPAAPGSLDPPPPEVRREMLRMEIEAGVADLQAEAGSLAAEAREAGLPEDAQELEAVTDAAAELADAVAANGSTSEPAPGEVGPDPR